MAHSSWAWANENYQGPKKSMKKSHENHNNDSKSNDRTLQKYRTRKVELSEMGFFTPSLMNHFFLINVFY